MRFGVTVNTGNYQSFRFDSSEHETIEDCIREIVDAMEGLEGCEYMRAYLESRLSK